MDMYSKMDGSTPVSQGLGGVWKIQKKPRADDQQEARKKNKEKKEEEKDFEDGRVLNDREMTEADSRADNGIIENDSKEDDPSPMRKIDIII
jgi:hypothetical protein